MTDTRSQASRAQLKVALEQLGLLLLVAVIVAFCLLAKSLDLSPSFALGTIFGALYLGLLARQAFLPASLPMKRRPAARNLENRMSDNTNEANLKRAIAKLQPNGRDVWCAALTPAEIVALVDAGAVSNLEAHVTRAREKLATGVSDSTWFYFTPRKELRAQILKAKT
jgi:hypothetical protein